MALSEKERKQLEALMSKDKEPDDDEDFEVTISRDGNEVRLPYRKAKAMLSRMGFDLDDLVEEEKEELPPKGKKTAKKVDLDDEPEEDEELEQAKKSLAQGYFKKRA